MDMQASAPMAKTNNPPAPAPASSMQPQQASEQAAPQLQQPIVPLTAGTQRPNEPVTTGAAMGAGAGLAAIGMNQMQMGNGASAKQAVQTLAMHPDASPELKRLASILGQ
jgi:hypothetical protein